MRLLFDVNQARAALTETAAASASLRQLHGYQPRLDAANEPVEVAVAVIRSQLACRRRTRADGRPERVTRRISAGLRKPVNPR